LKRLLHAWLPVLLLELLIIVVSSQSDVGVTTRHHLDKVAHIGEYAALSALLYRALRLTGGGRRESLTGAILLVGFLGGADEIYQSTVPGRDSSRSDWLADCCGAVLGAIGMHRIETLWPRLVWMSTGRGEQRL